MAKKKLNILILAGGESGERDVSLTSARAITTALISSGHTIRVLDTLDGRLIADGSGNFPENISSTAGARAVTDPTLALELSRLKDDGVDVVVNALHGGAGENGHIQALLEMLGLAYTGSPMAASAAAMNKDISKRIMRTLDIPTADWLCFNRLAQLTPEEITVEVESQLLCPMIVKPTDGGSTVGLTLVEDPSQLAEAIEVAFSAGDSVMIEKYMNGREITISLLDGKPLPPVEIKPSHKLYDYTCKYTKGKSEYICPAEIELETVEKLSRDAVSLYRTLGCRGYARVDFIVDSSGNYICLELNTLPGMTALSLFPMAARAVGIEFDRLLDKLCELALEGK